MSNRRVIVTIALLILFFLPDTQTPFLGRKSLDRILEEEYEALSVLNSTSYGDFSPEDGRWLNVSGLKTEYGYAWEGLRSVQDRAKEQAVNALGAQNAQKALDGVPLSEQPMYHNLSGYVRGDWVRSKASEGLKAPQLNLTAMFPVEAPITEHFNRNATGAEGKAILRFVERWDGDIEKQTGLREIYAELTIRDEEASGNGWSMALHGVHALDSGSLVLATTSEK